MGRQRAKGSKRRSRRKDQSLAPLVPEVEPNLLF